MVNVLAKSYRHLTLYNPGNYNLKLKCVLILHFISSDVVLTSLLLPSRYNGGMETIARWTVKELADCQTAKNVRSDMFRATLFFFSPFAPRLGYPLHR